ncbi:hypothetical protein ABZT17_12215 [Streptomyces sp. NPDC005648]|uniref:hypothetical protein n=1 Tax=Streptomyces sp. NPDC005648 TaxID=3157044 RepID=UPI0033A6950D
MEIRNSEPSRLFRATNGGAGLNFEHPCSHGMAAVSFHLLGQTEDGTEDDIGILLPTCSAPAIFGAALAYIEAAYGNDAGEEFLAVMHASRDQAAAMLAARRAQYEAAGRACCQAGFFTQGREHTCSPETRS